MSANSSTDERILSEVHETYSAIAQSGVSSAHADEVAKAFGYAAAELAAVPDGSHMGLSCGNPIAAASIKEGEVVLDLGSGGGIDVFLAAKKVGPTGRVIGIDMSGDMIALAERNAAKLNLQPPQVSFLHTSLTLPFPNPPLADASVDCVISNCVLNLLPNAAKATALREVFRVLKPGGRIALEDIVAKQAMPEDVRKDMAAYVGCVGGAVTRDVYEGFLHEAGFENVLMVDKKADLSVWFTTPDSNLTGVCCGTEPKATAPAGGACGASGGCGEKAAGLARPSVDVNELVGSYSIYAVKPLTQ
ncbi:S-adenosyl-L-methionine-dependent methyltransferase [Dentipellis sp. KUC8613]|nr:S-adenosyl-L-methionine-dependent methyltransferase [Dentipellis sp. KUC8613]